MFQLQHWITEKTRAQRKPCVCARHAYGEEQWLTTSKGAPLQEGDARTVCPTVRAIQTVCNYRTHLKGDVFTFRFQSAIRKRWGCFFPSASTLSSSTLNGNCLAAFFLWGFMLKWSESKEHLNETWTETDCPLAGVRVEVTPSVPVEGDDLDSGVCLGLHP